VLAECDVSLPQKANLVCKAKRFMEVLTMKDKWKLKVSPYGFALLDVPSPWTLVGRDFANPFTRFYLEGYLQTVLTTDLSLIVYKGLVNNITDKEISHNYNYRILSKFFEMSAKLGGVRLNFCLFVCLFVCLLVGWLVGWLVGCLVGWLLVVVCCLLFAVCCFLVVGCWLFPNA